MRTAFIVLATTNLVLIAGAIALGMLVTPAAGFERHFLMGLITGLYTCFVHVVAFMYFVVCEKIVARAAQEGQLSPGLAERAQRLKSRALRASLIGIAMILVTIFAGGASTPGHRPTAHLVAAFATFLASLGIFLYQYGLIDQSRRDFETAFGDGSTVRARVE